MKHLVHGNNCRRAVGTSAAHSRARRNALFKPHGNFAPRLKIGVIQHRLYALDNKIIVVHGQVAAVAGRIGAAQLDRLVAETIKRFDLKSATIDAVLSLIFRMGLREMKAQTDLDRAGKTGIENGLKQGERFMTGLIPYEIEAMKAVVREKIRLFGSEGKAYGMTTFGASGPYKELFPNFGFTPEKVAEAALEL